MATIQGIYIALFGRPADPLGLAFFNEATNNGADLTAIGDLAATAEYQSRFEGMSNAQIVTAIYQSLFGRNPELAGLEFFVAQLESGAQNINTIAINILDGAQGADAQIVANKEAAADAWTAAIAADPDALAAYQGQVGIDAGVSYLVGITADPATVPDAAATEAAVQALVDAAPAPGPVGGTFSLTTGVDYADANGSIKNGGLQPSDFAFTGRNDTVLANALTLNAGDALLDSSTTDNDRLVYTGNTVAPLGAAGPIQNIETFDVTLANAGASAAALGAVTGLQTLDVSGSIVAGAAVAFNTFALSGLTSVDASGVTGGVGSSFQLTDGTADQNVTYQGGAIADIVTLRDGNNTVDTGAGNDTITLGNGNNTVDAGAGNDTVIVGNGANTVNLGDGTDTLFAGNGNNVITSGAGVDTINVGNGNNTISTGAGNDVINVGTGSNTITAGAGADNINLGAGSGVNTLVFEAGDSPAAAGQFDIVTGFQVAAPGRDVLDFGGPEATAANLVIGAAVGAGDYAAAQAQAQAQFDGDITTVYYAVDDGANTWVFADTDGNNTIDFAVQLTGVLAATFTVDSIA